MTVRVSAWGLAGCDVLSPCCQCVSGVDACEIERLHGEGCVICVVMPLMCVSSGCLCGVYIGNGYCDVMHDHLCVSRSLARGIEHLHRKWLALCRDAMDVCLVDNHHVGLPRRKQGMLPGNSCNGSSTAAAVSITLIGAGHTLNGWFGYKTRASSWGVAGSDVL